MPSIYQPRRPRASPLWQLVNHGWADFLAAHEERHSPTHGPLDTAVVAVVQFFLRCGDLSSGFTRPQAVAGGEADDLHRGEPLGRVGGRVAQWRQLAGRHENLDGVRIEAE